MELITETSPNTEYEALLAEYNDMCTLLKAKDHEILRLSSMTLKDFLALKAGRVNRGTKFFEIMEGARTAGDLAHRAILILLEDVAKKGDLLLEGLAEKARLVEENRRYMEALDSLHGRIKELESMVQGNSTRESTTA